MSRIKFARGKQREFIEEVLIAVGSPSLRELSRRLQVNYSSLKNYYSELRLLPGDLFEDLLRISKVDRAGLKFEVLKDGFGQVLGGRKSKKK